MSKLSHVIFGIALVAATGAVQAGGDAAAGKAKAAQCAQCHGEDGNSPNAAFPRLAGQHADYLVHALAAYANGERNNPIMAPFAAALSAQDRADLAAWFSSQRAGVFSIDADALD